MQAGSLDRRITLLRRIESGVDERNAPIYEWLPIGTFWAAKTHRTETNVSRLNRGTPFEL